MLFYQSITQLPILTRKKKQKMYNTKFRVINKKPKKPKNKKIRE